MPLKLTMGEDDVLHLPRTTSTCCMQRQNSSEDDVLFLSPGPVDLIYGCEAPIPTEVVARNLSSVRRRRKRINHFSFLSSEFVDSEGLFRLLGKKLKKLYVRELAINHIMPRLRNDELISLSSFLNGNKTLRSLDLSGARFDAKALQEIRSFFEKNRSLEVLVLGDNECVGDEGAEIVVSSTLHNGKGALRTLSMQGCGLGLQGSASIANLLCFCSSLRTLELSKNKIGDAGVELLAQSIKSPSCQLEILGLNSVELGDRGVLNLADAVKTSSLISLSLQNNLVTSFGAKHLLKTTYNDTSLQAILGSNHVLTNLNFRGCSRIGPCLLSLTEELVFKGVPTYQVIRSKVSKFMQRGRLVLDHFDLELLPHILSFVGQTGGLNGLFQSVKSMPSLHAQYDLPVRRKLAGKEGTSTFTDFIESLKTPRKAKKLFERCTASVPKRRSMIRREDRRHSCKHETRIKSLSLNTNESSSNNILSTTQTSITFNLCFDLNHLLN